MRGGVRYGVIKLPRGRMAPDCRASRAFPAGSFQRIKLFQRFRISGAVMLQLKLALLDLLHDRGPSEQL